MPKPQALTPAFLETLPSLNLEAARHLLLLTRRSQRFAVEHRAQWPGHLLYSVSRCRKTPVRLARIGAVDKISLIRGAGAGRHALRKWWRKAADPKLEADGSRTSDVCEFAGEGALHSRMPKTRKRSWDLDDRGLLRNSYPACFLALIGSADPPLGHRSWLHNGMKQSAYARRQPIASWSWISFMFNCAMRLRSDADGANSREWH